MIVGNTLYSLDSDGNTRIWYMEIDGDRYRTINGVKHGATIVSEWTKAEEKNVGKKNYVSASMQAQKEVQAKYKKKLKDDYFETEEELGQVRFFHPMLAEKYKDRKKFIKDIREYGMSVKLNGGRCTHQAPGPITRTGEKFMTIPHISQSLSAFFAEFPNALLDGELYNFDYRQNLNDLMSLVNKTVNITQEDLTASENVVQLHIYDGFGFGAEQSSSYLERYEAINAAFANGKFHDKYIKFVPCLPIENEDEMMEFYRLRLEEGEEGIILRKWDAPYECKRSKGLLKMKPTDSKEVIILDINEGRGNWVGTGKVITVQDAEYGVYNVTFKGTKPDCIQFLADKAKWIGREVTITYNGLTGLNTPNFGQLNYRNCLEGKK